MIDKLLELCLFISVQLTEFRNFLRNMEGRIYHKRLRELCLSIPEKALWLHIRHCGVNNSHLLRLTSVLSNRLHRIGNNLRYKP